ncbi:MAG: methionine gamma-lyase family protein [Clostridia bacterium]|nr:methionine gamma-lyase family protein [Clostridia bacterium]MBO7171048.1 methionine gamma-lyase family protein [Clostridia bacterium]
MKLLEIVREAEERLAPLFARLDKVAESGTAKVMAAFREERVSNGMFASTDGYGYDDRGRDVLDKIYARVFDAEAAFVRSSVLSGTHALAIGLFGLLRPGDTLLALTGKPYDTLDEVIGLSGEAGRGSLKDFGVTYKEVPLSADGGADLAAITAALKADPKVKVAFIQRSKGYLDRRTLSVSEIGEIVKTVRAVSDAFVMVDNCYGEFVEETEPTAVGADLIVGSLIKNPGGGMAECGGYLAGTARAVELCGYRYTAPGVGLEIGASLGQNKNMYKGLFYAPHTVAQALKTAHLCAYVFEKLGYETSPRWDEPRYDIIQTVKCGTADGLIAFCRGIQYGSPIDAFVTCEPWDMPGYNDPVIMAAGTFTQGASLELSADGPVRPPYIAFMQGGLTYESGKLGIISAATEMLKLRNEN